MIDFNTMSTRGKVISCIKVRELFYLFIYIYIFLCSCVLWWFDFVSFFNGTSTFANYLSHSSKRAMIELFNSLLIFLGY